MVLKDMPKFSANVKKYMKMKEEDWPEDLSKVPHEQFEAALFK